MSYKVSNEVKEQTIEFMEKELNKTQPAKFNFTRLSFGLASVAIVGVGIISMIEPAQNDELKLTINLPIHEYEFNSNNTSALVEIPYDEYERYIEAIHEIYPNYEETFLKVHYETDEEHEIRYNQTVKDLYNIITMTTEENDLYQSIVYEQFPDYEYYETPLTVENGMYYNGKLTVALPDKHYEINKKSDILGVYNLIINNDKYKLTLEEEIKVQEKLNEMTLTNPLKEWKYVSTPYLENLYTIWGKFVTHKAYDLAIDSGTPIYAIADGTITSAKYTGSYGNLITIDHGNGIESMYAHTSSMNVAVGDIVKSGDKIGEVGTTGNSTGPHLHFELRYVDSIDMEYKLFDIRKFELQDKSLFNFELEPDSYYYNHE